MRVLLALCLALALTACSSNSAVVDPFQGVPAKQLFVQAKQSMAKGKYDKAVEQYESLATQYPFGPYAQRGLLDLMYAYYKTRDYPSTVAAADRYIHLYPRSARVDYAYYMRGVANSTHDSSLLGRYFPVDQSQRDLKRLQKAFGDFRALVRRYPNSRYTADAKQHMIYIRNMLAKRELHVATYYLEREAYVAAANRATYLIENYPQAPQAKRALKILVKANRAMGLHQSANDALAVLKLNYPNVGKV
jgi:outer membrane protein assembly factor BamD